MTAAASLIPELESALNSGSSEKRLATLRKMTDLFLNDADRLNETQIGVFDDVLVHLIQRIETRALAQLSATLAPVHNAPIQVVRRLSWDDDIAVAGPVLTRSTRLTEDDLLSVARSKGQGHLLAISQRSSLSANLTDTLIERGDGQVHNTLARNTGAHFSEAGYSELVQKSASDQALAESLGLRLDIPIKLLQQLLARAGEMVRSRLMAAASPEQRDHIQAALADVVTAVGKEAAGPRDFRTAESLVDGLNRKGKLNESMLAGFARDGKYEEMAATLALFCGVKTDLVGQLMKNVKHDSVVVACRAAKISWLTTNMIIQARFPHHSVPPHELDAAKDAFTRLTEASAQRSMRFMAAQESAKRTGTAIGF